MKKNISWTLDDKGAWLYIADGEKLFTSWQEAYKYVKDLK